MTQTKSILLVDDDARIRELMQRYLSENGFEVATLADASGLSARLERARPSLLILDLMMPGEDGLSVLRRLRAQHDPIPILMLTARGEDVDRILGLEMGADDYLVKPFNPRELLARVNALLRRQAPPSAQAVRQAQSHSVGRWTFDVERRCLVLGERSEELTQAEYALLRVLVEHPRHPLSREQLMNFAFGRSHEAFDRSVDVHISKLRRLIENDGKQPKLIQTVWGIGYVYIPVDTDGS